MLCMTPKNRATDRHKNPPLTIRPDPAVREALARYARSQRRSEGAQALFLLEEIMREKGLLPPDESTADPRGAE